MIWLFDKQKKRARIFGSLPVLCRNYPEISYKEMQRNFSRKKHLKFENENFLIVKVSIERGGKQK